MPLTVMLPAARAAKLTGAGQPAVSSRQPAWWPKASALRQKGHDDWFWCCCCDDGAAKQDSRAGRQQKQGLLGSIAFLVVLARLCWPHHSAGRCRQLHEHVHDPLVQGFHEADACMHTSGMAWQCCLHTRSCWAIRGRCMQLCNTSRSCFMRQQPAGTAVV